MAELALIPFAPAHFELLASWFANEREAVQWGGTGVRFPVDAPQLEAMLRQGDADPPARRCWMAQLAGQLVGHVQLALDRRHGVGLIGRVAIAPARRGQGLAVPMLRLVVAEGFAEPGIERLELNAYAFNAPAIRTYERVGFVREGVRRSAARVGDERWDAVMMGLLRADAGA